MTPPFYIKSIRKISFPYTDHLRERENSGQGLKEMGKHGMMNREPLTDNRTDRRTSMKLEFKEIRPEDTPVMMPYYSMRKNKTCDSVFLESFLWKEFYHVRYAIWEEKALLWLMEYNGRCFSAMPLCKEEDLPAAFAAIETYFNEELGYPLVINLADEYAVQYLNLSPEKYRVLEQADSGDYLYSAEALRKLSGRKLHKKKNRLNVFLREYEGRYEYRPLCCSDKDAVWKFLDHWRLQKGEDVEEHLDFEVRGIHDILRNCSMLNVRMGGVFIDGKLEAFSIGSYNPVENMAVIHIEKANPEINGLYQFINQQFLIHEFPEAEWVNREDDMGLEGLRKAKMSYNPADFARKYLVEQLMDGSKGYSWAENIGNTYQGESVEYLTEEQKEETRALWNSCFPEDSKGFCDYYYKEKTRDNQILVKKENGIVISMLQRNPYLLQVGDSKQEIDYLVGIATEEIHRKKGHMRQLLTEALRDMRQEGKAFTFLMPAAEAIYTPFDFRYVFWQPQWQLTQNAADSLERQKVEDTPEDCGRVGKWMEEWLSARYQVYARRDETYVSRLVKELASEEGVLEFLYDGKKPVGLQAFWGQEKREQRLLYTEEPYREETGEKPAIMVRITNLEKMLESISSEQEQAWILEVSDQLIPENQGRFLAKISSEGTSLQRLASGEQKEGDSENIPQEEQLRAAEIYPAEEKNLPFLQTDIAQLAQWIFGVAKPEELWNELDGEDLEKLKKVSTLQRVFLDEVV